MSRQGDPAQLGGRFDGWSSVLDRYGVQYLILDKERDGKLLSLVRARPGWAVDFEDGTSVLFTRSLPGGSEPWASDAGSQTGLLDR